MICGKNIPFISTIKSPKVRMRSASVYLESMRECLISSLLVSTSFLTKGMGFKPQKPVKWKQNGLRHSAASYWFAGCNDAGRVAGYLGNSAAVIHRHYRELVTPADAVKWFSIVPERAANILPMPNAAIATAN